MTYSTTKLTLWTQNLEGRRFYETHQLRCHTGTVKAALDSHSEELELTFICQLMFNSLITQYLIQAPDYHLFTQKVGCISGCASGFSLLEVIHRVFVDATIIPLILASNSSVPVAWGNPRRLYGTSTTKHYILEGLRAEFISAL